MTDFRPTLLERMTVVQALTLPARDKSVLTWLAYHAGDSWPCCWPSLETLCSDTGLGRHSVMRATCALAERKLIAVRRRRDVSNEYTLMIPVSRKSRPTDVAGCDFPRSQGATLTKKHEPRRVNRFGLDDDDEGDTYVYDLPF